MRERYAGRGKAGRGRLVDAVCQLCGYSRKHALKVLNGTLPVRGERNGRRGGRPRRYGAAPLAVLKVIWLAAEQPCGQRLVGALPLWLPHYQRVHGRLAPGLRRDLLAMSAASLNRLLQPCRVRYGSKRRCGTKPGGLLKQQVAVRCGPWAVTGPGWLEADTVAHCGGSLAGDLVWSVTLTDLHTQWTETRAVWNKGASGVLAAIADMERTLPFPVLGVDSDNGSEFLNWHLHDYFKQRPVPINFTRSREYQKNDNAHVEQKNWTHVRQLVGYDRLGHPEQAVRLNELYTGSWNRFRNYFCPVMKLSGKTRAGGRIKRRYDTAKTPFQRLAECLGAHHPTIRQLQTEFDQLDPFALKTQLQRQLKALWQHPCPAPP
jgi:hypothetical protein